MLRRAIGSSQRPAILIEAGEHAAAPLGADELVTPFQGDVVVEHVSAAGKAEDSAVRILIDELLYPISREAWVDLNAGAGGW